MDKEVLAVKPAINRLYDAAAEGDAAMLEELLRENPHLLKRGPFPSNPSPLHEATMRGHENIVEILLSKNSQLAEELDSQKSSPLHIAAAKGYVGIASKLLSVATHMCSSRDCHDMNPIHIAAMNGHVEILKKLIEEDPVPAREKVGHGQNVMHLCVKHGRLEALQFLAHKDDLSELVKEGDDNGDTLLHLAVRYNQDEIFKYLVESEKIDEESRNAKGKTPLQISSESPDPATTSESPETHSQIREILKYDSTTLDEFLQENQHLFSNRSPLHVATMRGHENIVESMLRRNPQLAEELDSQISSPLHIAAAKGYVRIASKLLSVAPHMCWSRDCHGMNPIHIAAMNGHVQILEEMIRLDPFPAREKLGHGQNVMHLCVKHRQFEALKSLADNHNLSELVNEGDENGDTVLHLAARYKQREVIRYLVENNIVDKNSRNAKGETAQRDGKLDFGKLFGLASLNNVIIVVVILIATMAFRAAVRPPGGVWQEDSLLYKAGDAVMAFTHPRIYTHFKLANIVAFVSSMVVIMLLTTNLPSRFILIYSATIYMTWVSVASIVVSFGASVLVTSPNAQARSFNLVMIIVMAVCVVPLVIFSVGTLLHEIYKHLKSEE